MALLLPPWFFSFKVGTAPCRCRSFFSIMLLLPECFWYRAGFIELELELAVDTDRRDDAREVRDESEEHDISSIAR